MEQLVKQLRNTLGKTEIALGAITDCIVWTNAQGNIEWCNSAFDRLVEREHLFVIGEPLTAILPLQGTDPHQVKDHPLNRLRQSEGRSEGEYLFLTSSGTKVLHFSCIATKIGGAEFCIVCSIRDITQQVEDKKCILKRTEELARSNADLERFAYATSHDLKQPLRSIKMFADIVLTECGDEIDDASKKYLRHITNATDNMVQLIDSLLAYARIDARGKELIATNLEKVLEEVKLSIFSQIKEAHAEVKHDPLPFVIGDIVLLQTLFQNLLSNSIKYCKGRVPKIHIGVEERGNDFLISVKDNGVGIEKRYHEQVFEMFKRLETDKNIKGSGLGLSICQRIVVCLGGRIWIDSTPGEGTTVFFNLQKARRGA